MVYGESDEFVLDNLELDVYIITCCPPCAPDKQPSLWIRVVGSGEYGIQEYSTDIKCV